MYKRLGIYRAQDINEEWIAKQLRIYIKHIDRPSHFARDGRFKAILLDSRVDRKQRRMEFMHELGHLLRSADGFNYLAPELRNYLEWDARHFEFYAAMPYPMMRQYDLNDCDIINTLSDDFVVPHHYVEDKLTFIKQKQQQYARVTF
ncbi:ImmA/IrrE family metallo-endopeptidase [Paenalkalicoccus suaedae]|uniref:ImmA/IrrE family metallo-endopeptidase n=2 Tax=Paenalkalicoccus suaedae TaxID=2592382 RepID=A0A859FGF5_9BACI|nr:ImmA/IrrE family metallo-endopeptidase [Paenalkalicoccus suaedae]QKS71752.1 ImmA/IrrE family metallo-endopeptidase [Paenalkalicoccus suaedae]